ncbi:MAG TPA: YlxR family protein [Actinomycetota bacterium]|nr:YlxR family protein [Actinomycetota bacterium]
MGEGPMRTCVGCRRRRLQEELLRIAKGPDGSLTVGARVRAPGRGAYVCFDPECVRRALASGALSKSLKIDGPLPEGLGRRLLETTQEQQGKR